MTASTELGVEDFNDETGGNVTETVPTPEPQEPDQQGKSEKTGGVQPHDSGMPHGNVLTDDQA
jgi:hypothetical protein